MSAVLQMGPERGRALDVVVCPHLSRAMAALTDQELLAASDALLDHDVWVRFESMHWDTAHATRIYNVQSRLLVQLLDARQRCAEALNSIRLAESPIRQYAAFQSCDHPLGEINATQPAGDLQGPAVEKKRHLYGI